MSKTAEPLLSWLPPDFVWCLKTSVPHELCVPNNLKFKVLTTNLGGEISQIFLTYAFILLRWVSQLQSDNLSKNLGVKPTCEFSRIKSSNRVIRLY